MDILFAERLPDADMPVAYPVIKGGSLFLPGTQVSLPITASQGQSSDPLTVTVMTGALGDRVATTISVGIGDPGSLTPNDWRTWGAKAVWTLAEAGQEAVCIVVPMVDGSPVASRVAAACVAEGVALGSHIPDPMRLEPPKNWLPLPLEITIVTDAAAGAADLWPAVEDRVAAVEFARDLANLPSNMKQPDQFTERLRELEGWGITLSVLDVDALEAEGCGALLAVGQGSSVPPRLVLLEWRGAGDEAPIALIGKGITFDTGGITLKPPARMWEMRQDMSGAAAVTGALQWLAMADAKVNAIGVLALAENAIGERAFRPGDILTTAKGLTVEVRDTDAEGRLVLADALAYTAKHYKPQMMIDVATLTGSVIAGLGRRFAGLFADDAVAELLQSTAERTGDALWRMPLDPYYRRKLASDIADLMQVGPDEERGDCCFGAAFLKEFAGNIPFGHIDTGDLVWEREATGTTRYGATGFGVELLAQTAVTLFER